MKIDELKNIAEENGYVLTRPFDKYKLERKNSGNCIDISNVNTNRVWISNISICDDKDLNMIKAAVEFAETPIEDREEEKKFYLRHQWENKKFTLKEIEEIKEKFNTDLADFELVEVE